MIKKFRQRFRPTFWPTVFTVPALIVLIGLGFWQLDRLQWKDDLIAERQGRAAGPAIDLPLDIVDPAALEYRLVTLTGHFLHEREMFLGARSHNGNVGFDVITPLELTDGRSILVDRGWVPKDRKDPASRTEGQIIGSVTINALLRSGGWKGRDFARPDNRPADNYWFWVDIPAMAEQVGLYKPVTELYAAAGPAKNPGGFPIGGQTRLDLRNDHLQYAITWFILALALAVIYVVYHTRREDEGEGGGGDSGS